MVPHLWQDATVLCIAGGPSLTPEDVAWSRGRARVIAINDAYRLAPWADVLYAADARWWRWHKGAPAFGGLKFSIENIGEQDPRAAGLWPGVTVLENCGEDGLELNPKGLRTGMNSGYQAINLAVLLGARRVVLLGYDMQRGADDRAHWFGQHAFSDIRSPYAKFCRAFESLVEPLRAIGVEVINASRQTALEVFPRLALEDALR